MPIDINTLLKQLETGIADLAVKNAKGFVDQAKSDGQALITSLSEDIKQWTADFVANRLTKVELESLVLTRKNTIKMVALKQAGLAAVKTDQFKSDVLNLIVTTISSVV